MLEQTEEFWRQWSARCTYRGPWREAVLRSLITLKALTYAPTGGIVAAPTTSLPEKLGGVRNWDYRYCWVRDATFTLDALMANGYTDEALAWRQWLLRAVAGSPSELNIMYGIKGQRRLPEMELAWLPGYENSRPVRIGNDAHRQFQLDVYGELIDAMFHAQRYGTATDDTAWHVEEALIGFLENGWKRPDEGIWEVRGPQRHFTHSKVMAWVAFDRMVKAVERYGLEGPVDRWRTIRDAIHQEVCQKGIDPQRNCFVQYYGGKEVDASLLMIPLVGFLPVDDPRMQATIQAIQRDLSHDGFIKRYPTKQDIDGLPPGEAAFLACTFWMVDNLALSGRREEALTCFERLLGLRNDVGLLAEEYDPTLNRLLGNFPQAFSHIALVESALNLSQEPGAAGRLKRSQDGALPRT
jgi:GH15 family glucan-1,4-alpha-glucosidase